MGEEGGGGYFDKQSISKCGCYLIIIVPVLLFTQTLTSALLPLPSVTSMPTAQILLALIAVLASLDFLAMANHAKVTGYIIYNIAVICNKFSIDPTATYHV